MKRKFQAFALNDEGLSQDSNSHLVPLSPPSNYDQRLVCTRNCFRSYREKSLVIRFSTTSKLKADRLFSIDHPNIRPYTTTFAHSYDVPRLSANHFQVAPFAVKVKDQTRTTLKNKPIILRFRCVQPSKPSWGKTFRSFPAEIRNMIFEEMVRNTWKGRTPSIINAFRVSRKYRDMYHDIMYAFYKTNCYMLHQGNGWCFGDMRERAISTIRSLGIDIGDPGLWAHFFKLNWAFRLPPVERSLRFQTLHLTDTRRTHHGAPIASHRRDRDRYLSLFLKEFVFPYDRETNFIHKRHRLKLVILNTQLELHFINTLLRKVNARVGRRPKLARVTSSSDLIWFWDVSHKFPSHDLPEDMERYEAFARKRERRRE